MTDRTRGADFLGEATSYLDVLRGELAVWAVPPTDASVRRALRAMHSLKGAAGFVGDDAIETRAHALEDLLLHFTETESDPSAAGLVARIRAGTAELARELGTEDAATPHPRHAAPE